jgi:tRNA threonylcarbamoyladenosine biosynthesis protein TsaB
VKLVALEVATKVASVALLDGERVVERDFDPRGEGAVAALARLLAAEGVRPGEVDAFAASVGPGSFTGIRIGVSAAQGFCRATGAKAVPVGTLDALAELGRESEWGVPGSLLLPSVDARRGEVYAAVYRVPDTGWEPTRLWGPDALSCAELTRRLAEAPIPEGGPEGVLLGDGAALLAHLFPPGWAAPALLARTRAGSVAKLAARKLARGEAVAPEALEPAYVRKSDAEIRRERRASAR